MVHNAYTCILALIMANMQTNSFIHDTGLNEENTLTHLLNSISSDEEKEAFLIEHSNNLMISVSKTFYRIKKSKLSILSLNSQSISAKFDKLKMFIDNVNKLCPISAICIQESGLTMELT